MQPVKHQHTKIRNERFVNITSKVKYKILYERKQRKGNLKMYRSRILNLTLHRNVSLKSGLIISINRRPISNLKQQCLLSPIINNIYDENYNKPVKNGITKTIITIPNNNDSLLNTQNNNNNNLRNKSRLQNSLNKHSKDQYFSNSMNKINHTNCNILHKTSALLSPSYNSVKKLCLNHTGVRNFSSDAIQQRVQPIELKGFWKDMSESAPVEFVQENLMNFQSFTNLPWWATIVLTTFIVRGTLTLPLSLYQHYIFARVQNLRIEMTDIVKKLQMDANVAVSHYGWTENYARMMYDRSVKRKWNELVQKNNCHPAKGLIVLWTQIPVWITISAALRNLCYMLPPGNTNAERIYLELTTGGFGWVVNLIDVDHYWIIPVSVGVFNLANIEIMSLMKMKEDTKLQKYLLYFFRFISIAMIPIATYVPSCICLYWASSSAFGLLQNLALLSPKVRRFGRVPLTSTERSTPYSDLVEKFRAKKYFNFKSKSNTSLE